MRGMRAAVASAALVLLAVPAWAETPLRPMPRPSTAASEPVAAPKANPRGPAAGASLAGVAIGLTPARLGIPASSTVPVQAASLDPAPPRPRPASPTTAPAEVARLAAIPAIRALPRPAQPAAIASLPRTAAPERLQQAAFVAPMTPDVLTTRKGAVCGLASLQGRTVAPIQSRVAGCGVAQPVEITAVDGVPLSQPATIDCGTALALDRWVKTGLKRAVGGQGGGVAKIQIAGSYVCRPMNNIRGNKISEHGRGRAIDVSGVVLKNGDSFSIARDYRKGDAAFLRAAHRAACGVFGTTLGPGSDGHHEDHLHFDSAVHRSPYCR